MSIEVSSALKELDSGWVLEECEGADFGDKRLNVRLGKTLSHMSGMPQSPLNQSCPTLGETLGAYRFIDNENVSVGGILAPHIEHAQERAKNEEVVLCIQDTSYLNFNKHLSCEGLGYIGREPLTGALMHSVFAVLPSGLPLGVLDLQFHTRKKVARRGKRATEELPLSAKESRKWLASAKNITGLFSPKTTVVHVADREADIFDLFHHIEKQGEYYLIRSRSDRRLEEGERLFELLDESQPSAKVTYLIPSKGGRQQREAKLEIKFIEVTLSVPTRRGANTVSGMSPVDVWCVEAKEVNPPEGEAAVCWRLLTNMPVDTVEEAIEKISWYSRRWAIEEFHKILKSGCRVEKAQFQTLERLTKYIALRSIVAWRIYYLVHLNRIQPDASVAVVLTKSEVDTLETLVNDKRRRQGKNRKLKIKTVKQAITEVAKLGGYLNRATDKYPGITVMWRGMTSLAISTKTFIAVQRATYV